MMLGKIDLEKILLLDIETVPGVSAYSGLDDRFQALWDKKAAQISRYAEGDTPEELYERAGIFAEFGKIVCISVGYFTSGNEGLGLRITSYKGDDELQLLKDFKALLDQHFWQKWTYMCGHNAKEFDFPYLSRRMLINGLELPSALNTHGKKPWELDYFLDTMLLWSFGDRKNFTSLDVLAAVFNLPSPKDTMSGDKVGTAYWDEGDLDKIVEYCEGDVVTLANVLLKLMGKVPVLPENVEYVLRNG